MGDWPDDWFRDGHAADDSGAADGGSAPSGDKTVSIPTPQHRAAQFPAGQRGASHGPGPSYGAGAGGRGGAGAGGREGAGAGGRRGAEAGGRGGAGAGGSSPAGSWPAQPPLTSSGGSGSGSGFDSWSGYGPGGSFNAAGGGAGGAGGAGGHGLAGAGGAGGAGGGVATPTRLPSRTGGPGRPGRSGWRLWARPRRIFGVLVLIIALLVAGVAGTYFYLNSKLSRSNILLDYAGRPLPGAGTNWLIAGSDSRQGLTRAQERQYSTGRLTGAGRSDTILILHIPSGGGGMPILISIPRDSYVDIPGVGMDKINAAFSIGGPALLAKTVQNATGLYINHYMDIGFGGFVNVVNAVGGVRMCVTAPLRDQASGVNLRRGCQILSGGEALAYVRDRHSFATQDLQREQDQRLFLKALLTKMTSSGVLFNPFAVLPAASGAVANLTVDNGTSLYQLYQAAMALKSTQTTTVPIANSNYVTSAGDAVLWDRAQALVLFRDLQNGQPVPKSLITGSKLGG
jgi:LCP family protein required for cell wall assembly